MSVNSINDQVENFKNLEKAYTQVKHINDYVSHGEKHASSKWPMDMTFQILRTNYTKIIDSGSYVDEVKKIDKFIIDLNKKLEKDIEKGSKNPRFLKALECTKTFIEDFDLESNTKNASESFAKSYKGYGSIN